MISEKMVTLGTKKSVIREIFEYSKKRAAEIGSENVFDFSIGNPNVPAPVSVHETIKELLDSKVIMPRAIDLIANGKVTVEDGHVKIKE